MGFLNELMKGKVLWIEKKIAITHIVITAATKLPYQCACGMKKILKMIIILAPFQKMDMWLSKTTRQQYGKIGKKYINKKHHSDAIQEYNKMVLYRKS